MKSAVAHACVVVTRPWRVCTKPLAEVRHGTIAKQPNPFRISSGDRRVCPFRACGPRNLMKISPRCKIGRGSER